ncbi:MAG: hypothetical protein ACTS3F_01865 [Phycisphaerales bacterium]
MAIDDIGRVFSMLFTAPSQAMVKACADQRRVWIEWLEDLRRVLDGLGGEGDPGAIIAKHLRMAPAWRMDAQVCAAIQMRVASITRMGGEMSLGLGLSGLSVAGRFGFSQENSTESTLHATVRYAFSNDAEVSLSDYMKDVLRVDQITTVDQLNTAIGKLKGTLEGGTGG